MNTKPKKTGSPKTDEMRRQREAAWERQQERQKQAEKAQAKGKKPGSS